MTPQQVEELRQRLDAMRDGALSLVKQLSIAMAALPSEPAPPQRDPHDDSDIQFAGSKD